MLAQEKSENLRQQMMVESFGAWQSLAAQGLTKSNWKKYAESLNLSKRVKESKEEKERLVKEALEMHAKFNKG